VTKPSYQIDEGYFVELTTLAKHLTEMSHDVHQWGAIAVAGTYRRGNGSPESYALIVECNGYLARIQKHSRRHARFTELMIRGWLKPCSMIRDSACECRKLDFHKTA
jgi:hypothetical protein